MLSRSQVYSALTCVTISGLLTGVIYGSIMQHTSCYGKRPNASCTYENLFDTHCWVTARSLDTTNTVVLGQCIFNYVCENETRLCFFIKEVSQCPMIRCTDTDALAILVMCGIFLLPVFAFAFSLWFKFYRTHHHWNPFSDRVVEERVRIINA